MGPMGYARHTPPPSGGRDHSLHSDVAHLSQRLDRLCLACQALWELVRDNTALSDEDIATKVAEVDLRDGQSDGKLRTRGGLCPDCQRPLNARHDHCLYCGTPVPSASPFLA